MIHVKHVLSVIKKHEAKLRKKNRMDEDDLVWLSFNPAELPDFLEVARRHPTHALIIDGDQRVSPGNFYVSSQRIDFLVDNESEEGDEWQTSVSA